MHGNVQVRVLIYFNRKREGKKAERKRNGNAGTNNCTRHILRVPIYVDTCEYRKSKETYRNLNDDLTFLRVTVHRIEW